MPIDSPSNKDNNEQLYYSAEFELENPKVLYQFKLRKNRDEPLFAILKEGSYALENLKEGDIVPMKFYSNDKNIPVKNKITRIKYIIKDIQTGFKDHYMVGLDPDHMDLVVA